MLIRLIALTLVLTACATPQVKTQVPVVATPVAVPAKENLEVLCVEHPCVPVAALMDKITETSAADTLRFMASATLAKADAVIILILSPGGSLPASRIIFETLQSSKIPSYCYVGALAASGAFWVLQACTERVAEPNARLLVHEGFVKFNGGEDEERVLRRVDLLRIADTLDVMNKNMFAGIAPRMLMTPESLAARVADGDWVMSASEALTAHAIDRVVPDDPETYIKSVTESLRKK